LRGRELDEQLKTLNINLTLSPTEMKKNSREVISYPSSESPPFSEERRAARLCSLFLFGEGKEFKIGIFIITYSCQFRISSNELHEDCA
jgi:hypothetical protein